MFVSPFAQTMGLVCQPRQPLLAQLRGTGPAEARRRIGLILSCSTEQHIGSASSAFSPLERRCGTMMSLHGAAAASRIGREVQRRPTHVDTSHHLMAIGDPDGISRAAPAMRGSLSLAAAATNAPLKHCGLPHEEMVSSFRMQSAGSDEWEGAVAVERPTLASLRRGVDALSRFRPSKFNVNSTTAILMAATNNNPMGDMRKSTFLRVQFC